MKVFVIRPEHRDWTFPNVVPAHYHPVLWWRSRLPSQRVHLWFFFLGGHSNPKLFLGVGDGFLSQRVTSLIVFVSRVALHPFPIRLNDRVESIKFLPKVDILYLAS